MKITHTISEDGKIVAIVFAEELIIMQLDTPLDSIEGFKRLEGETYKLTKGLDTFLDGIVLVGCKVEPVKEETSFYESSFLN